MITPLRRRHRLMTLIATLTLPAALWMTVSAREEVPLMAAEALPGGAPAELDTIKAVSGTGFLIGGALTQHPEGAQLSVKIRTSSPLPQSLLYWEPAEGWNPPEGDGGMRFLTVARPGVLQLTLPREADDTRGKLVLWDVARGEPLDSLPVPAAEEAP